MLPPVLRDENAQDMTNHRPVWQAALSVHNGDASRGVLPSRQNSSPPYQAAKEACIFRENSRDASPAIIFLTATLSPDLRQSCGLQFVLQFPTPLSEARIGSTRAAADPIRPDHFFEALR